MKTIGGGKEGKEKNKGKGALYSSKSHSVNKLEKKAEEEKGCFSGLPTISVFSGRDRVRIKSEKKGRGEGKTSVFFSYCILFYSIMLKEGGKKNFFFPFRGRCSSTR